MNTTSAASIWPAAHADDDRRPRSRQRQLGASDTVCERRAAYKVHDIEPTDQVDGRAAVLGTYLHTGFLTAARTEYGWLVEKTVADDQLRGHVDIVQLDETTARRLPARLRPRVPAERVTVEDVKTKSAFVWDRVVRYGPSEPELRQLHLYADLLRSAGFADEPGQRVLARLGPIEVHRLRFRFVNRNDGQEHVYEIPFDEQRAAEARWWVQRVVETAGPHQARRSFDGPGLDAICDYCPFATACWGVPARPGGPVQPNVIHDDAERTAVLEEYARGREMAGEGARIQRAARAKIDGSPAGVYGRWQLSWGGGSARAVPDVAAMVELFEDANLTVPTAPNELAMVARLKAAGIPVPTRQAGGGSSATISVTAARQS